MTSADHANPDLTTETRAHIARVADLLGQYRQWLTNRIHVYEQVGETFAVGADDTSMTLLDAVEYFADWHALARPERTDRVALGPQLGTILQNTWQYFDQVFGWVQANAWIDRGSREYAERMVAIFQAMNAEFTDRAVVHDASKLAPPEVDLFAYWGPKLRTLIYGSSDYYAALDALRPALNHHYAHNRHHPEYFANGIAGMALIDVLEMLADWKAASERHADGTLAESIRINTERFSIDERLAQVLRMSRYALNW